MDVFSPLPASDASSQLDRRARLIADQARFCFTSTILGPPSVHQERVDQTYARRVVLSAQYYSIGAGV